MPWRETSVMDERLRFVRAYRAGETAMTELCRQAQISRKTGYKWVERFAESVKQGCSIEAEHRTCRRERRRSSNARSWR